MADRKRRKQQAVSGAVIICGRAWRLLCALCAQQPCCTLCVLCIVEVCAVCRGVWQSSPVMACAEMMGCRKARCSLLTDSVTPSAPLALSAPSAADGYNTAAARGIERCRGQWGSMGGDGAASLRPPGGLSLSRCRGNRDCVGTFLATGEDLGTPTCAQGPSGRITRAKYLHVQRQQRGRAPGRGKRCASLFLAASALRAAFSNR